MKPLSLLLCLFILLDLLIGLLDRCSATSSKLLRIGRHVTDGLAALGSSLDNLHHVLVAQWMAETARHGRELAALTPDVRRLEIRKQRSMDLTNGVLDREATSTRSKNDGIVQVRSLTTLLGVDANHGERLPNLLQENIESELQLHRNARVQGLLRDKVDFLDGNDINLVVHIEALDVLASALDNINQVVDIVVTAENDVRVMNLVLVHNIGNHLSVDLRQVRGRVELNTAGLLGLDLDVRLLLVETNADLLELQSELRLLGLTLLAVKHHENEIGRLADTDNLTTATLTVRRAFNNTGQIEQLHLGLVDIKETGDARERCELVGGSHGLGIAELVKQRGLADGRETDHGNSSVTVLLDVETFTFDALLDGSFFLHGLQLGETRLQLTPMVLGGLILLSLGHLNFDVLDLVSNTHFV